MIAGPGLLMRPVSELREGTAACFTCSFHPPENRRLVCRIQGLTRLNVPGRERWSIHVVLF
jgi:hypothetical protein